VGVSDGQSSATFAYNGLGDRLQQTVGGVTTQYTLDLNNSLTQVLSDGTNHYLYGMGRIAQQAPNGLQYFLPDALGSVRQLTDAAGAPILAQSFDPYGGLLSSQGSATTSYGFTGEWGDTSGLTYLRARYYLPQAGIFTVRDTWAGDFTAPGSLNRYVYAWSNPLKYVDPTGHAISPPACPFGCTIWDYSGVGGSSFGGRLLRAFISTGTELVDFILTKGATQTDSRACTWNLAEYEDRFIAGATPPNLLGVIGGRQLPLPGFEDILRTQVSGKLSDAEKNALRNEARGIFYKAYPRLAERGLEVHHRIPLEWAHLFPEADPNRLSNLIGLDPLIHDRIDLRWNSFRAYYNRLGRSPTMKEILEFAAGIDKEFSQYYNRLLEKKKR
jgi:RHS repeat-associated protein